MEIREDRRMALALRWLIASARKRPGKTMAEKLAGELSDAFPESGHDRQEEAKTPTNGRGQSRVRPLSLVELGKRLSPPSQG